MYFGIDAIRIDLTDETADTSSDETRKGRQDFKDTLKMSLEECAELYATAAETKTPFTSAVDDQLLRLVKIYLEADRLQDLVTSNLVIDEIVRFVGATNRVPRDKVVNHVYENSVHGNPMRMLLRDYSVYHSSTKDYLGFTLLDIIQTSIGTL